MRRRFQKYTSNFILLVVALQILNMSITGRITDDATGKNDNSVNIADYAVEYIVENVLGYREAFPEFKEVKQQHTISSYIKMQQFTYQPFKQDILTADSYLLAAIKYSPLYVDPYCSHTVEIITPPPQS